MSKQRKFRRAELVPAVDDLLYGPAVGPPPIPSDWVKGQLLNVRNAGDTYRVTVLGEEYDYRSPERCLEFTNSWECQQFVSAWYSRESHDPRAG